MMHVTLELRAKIQIDQNSDCQVYHMHLRYLLEKDLTGSARDMRNAKP